MKKTVLALVFSLTWVSSVQAAEFDADLQAEYSFAPSSPAKVTLDYTLTNTNAAVFVQNYQVILPGSAASIVVQNKDEDITKEVHTDHDRQVLDLAFQNDTVGQGKKRKFALEYIDSKLLGRRGGSQLIRIPALEGYENLTTYKTIVRLPLGFGSPDLLTPQPSKVGTASGQLVYTFDQKDGQTINIGFGQKQVLQFNYERILTNLSNYPAYAAAIFPGDQEEVSFVYANIAPTPDTWEVLPDGRWRGIYLLDIGAHLPVRADGFLIYKHLDHEFRLNQFYPELESDLQIWDRQAPDSFLYATPSAHITGSTRYLGPVPIFSQYELSLTNLTGRTLPGMSVHVTDPSGQVKFTPAASELTLYPWQKSVIIGKVGGSWWRLYQPFTLTVSLQDESGKIINEQTVTGLRISYLALAGLGGIIAAAAVAGSLLVDGRKQKGYLRRQGKKSPQSAQLVQKSGTKDPQNEGDDGSRQVHPVEDPAQ